MKMLFWKEWRELRALPLGAAVAAATLMIGLKVVTRWPGEVFPATGSLFGILVGVWLLFSAVAVAGTVAQENGAGTLQFLSSLPVSRRTVWLVKSSAALAALLASQISSTIVWVVLCALWAPSRTHSLTGWPWPGILASALLFMLSVFAIGLAISPFFDRALSAVVAAIVAALAIESLFVSIFTKYDGSHGFPLLFTLVGLSIPTFAAISYWTFTRGEALRDGRRFKAAGAAAGICLAIDAIIVLTAGALGAW